MSWYTHLTASPAQPLTAPTSGLILVEPRYGPVSITLPSTLGARPLFFVRRDSSTNLVTLTPQAPDSIVPASSFAPSIVLAAGWAAAMIPTPGRSWYLAESGLGLILREATMGALRAFGTIAGDKVESERVDGVQMGDTPRIVVFADEDAESAGSGGSAPAFDCTANVLVQCLVERPRKLDALADLDLLMLQVRDCLLGDPVWPTLAGEIKSVRATRVFKADRDLILADGRIQMTLTWTEQYTPRVTMALNTVTLTTTPSGGTTPVGNTITL